MKVRVIAIVLLAACCSSFIAFSSNSGTVDEKKDMIVEAMQKKDTPQVIKSLIAHMKDELEIDAERFPQLIKELEEYTSETTDPLDLAVLHSMIAQMYNSYYQSNRWKINQRTKLSGYIPAGIDEWSSNLFEDKVKEKLALSLSPAGLLQQTPASRFKEIMETGEDSPVLRPTLYDFLAWRALMFQPSDTIYKDLLAFRYTQPDKKPAVMVELEYLAYQRTKDSSEEALAGYEARLDSLLKQYGTADFSTEIRWAKIQQMEQNMYKTSNRDSVYTLQYEICKEGIARFPNYERIGLLQNKLYALERASLFVIMPNTVYPGDNVELRLEYKNVSSAAIRVYESKRPLKEITGYGETVKEDTRGKMVKEIPLSFSAPLSYGGYDTAFQIAIEKPGLYECVVSSEEKKIEAVTWVSVSRLAVVSRNVGKDVEVLVTDYKTGKPVPQATVTWFGGQRRDLEPQGKTQTDKDGLAVISNDTKAIGYQAALPGDTASRLLTSYSYNAGEVKVNTETRVSLFTDRGVYRPGQTLFFKGIAYLNDADNQQVVANQSFTVIFRDANNKEVAKKEYKSNEFGSFNGEFVLPQHLLSGLYSMHVGNNYAFVRVEEYKRPTFAVELSPVKEEITFGDSVFIRGKVQAFSGVSLSEGEIVWRIERSPFWARGGANFSDRQEAEGKTTIGEDGTFVIPFYPEDLKSSVLSYPPYYTYSVYVTVTDSKGETLEASSSFKVGKASFALSMDLPDKADKDTTSLKVVARTLNGSDVSTTGIYRIVTLEESEESKNWRGWMRNTPPVYEEGKIITDGTFETDKPLNKNVLSSLNTGRYRIKLEAKDEKGRLATHEQDVVLYSKKDKRPPVSAHFWVIEENMTSLPGEEVKFLVGTSDKDAYILYDLYANGKRISRERFRLTNENRTFSLPFREEWGDGVVAVFAFVKEGALHETMIRINRKQPNKKLAIKPVTFRDRLLPGAEECWTYRIWSADSSAVQAEVLASMYDASLDVLQSFSWNFSPVRPVYLQAPRFSNWTGFNNSFQSATEEQKSVTIKEYQYDGIDWQGIVFLENGGLTKGDFYIRGTGGGMADVVAGAATVNMMMEEATVVAFAKQKVRNDDMDVADAADGSMDGSSQIRRNFNETAFFYPALRTNESGDVLVCFTVPESNTTWKLQAVAHTTDLKFGQLTQEIITSKPLMVLPNLPRFVREGDKASIAVQVMNQSEKGITGDVKLELFNPYTEQVIESLKQPKQTFSLAAGGNTTRTWIVTIPEGVDLIGCRLIADSDEAGDGEQHILPVLSNQVLLTESIPFYLLNAGEKRIQITDKPGRQSFRLTLELSGNPVWYAVQALPTITEPKNDDILSWFASYYSNTLASYIVKAHPRMQRIIELWTAQGGNASTLLSNLEKNEELKNVLLEETPWVLAAESETEQKQRLSLLFDINRAQSQREMALKRLLDQQTAEGGWSWFKGFFTSRSITLSVLKGMSQLTQLDAVEYNEQEKNMQIRALRYLDESIQKDYEQLKKFNKDWQQAVPSSDQLTYLYVRSNFSDVPEPESAREAIRFYTEQAEKEWTKFPLAGKVEIALLAQKNGKKEIASSILASLRKTATVSTDEGMYWANNRRGADYFTSPVDVHCLLMSAFNELSPDKSETDKMKQWLLNQKRTQNWESVPATVNAIYAILLTGSDWLNQNNVVTVQWGDKRISTESGEAATGYIKEAVNSKDITPQMNNLTIRKEGNAPAWGALYNQYFEALDKVSGQKSILSVEKKLFVEFNSGTEKQIRPVTAEQPLRIGDKVIVRLTVRTDREMDYVSLKDLRAGCFEPANTLSGYSYKDGVGFYASPKDASENFFFTHLPKGTFVLEYPVYVSRSGEYADGISTIQCLYAPEFVSHTAGGRLTVNDK